MEYKPETLEMDGKPDKKRDELKGKVLKLKDLVSYQDGTVASRMVINRKAGSITLFSFDENEGLSEHTAPYDATVTLLEGECEVWVAGKTWQMKRRRDHHLSCKRPPCPVRYYKVQDESDNDTGVNHGWG